MRSGGLVLGIAGVVGLSGCASPPPPPAAEGEAEAWARKASEEARHGRWPEALAALERAEASAPGSVSIKRAAGAVLLRLGRPADAEAKAREGLLLDPASIPLEHLLAQALRLKGDLDGAWLLYEKVWRASPGEPIIVRERADLAMLRGDARTAAEGYRALLSSGSADPTNLGNLAAAELARGELEAALRHAEEAIAKDPKNGLAYKTRGAVLARRGRYDEALEALETGRRLSPSRPEPLVVIASIRAARGEWAEARRAYERLARLYEAQKEKPGVEAFWRFLLASDDPAAFLEARIAEAKRGEACSTAGEEVR